MKPSFEMLLFIFYRVCINVIALGLAGAMFKHIEVNSFAVLVIAAIILTALNFLVKPILFLISLPVVFLTMGIGYLVLNALILMLVTLFVDGYYIDGFWTAFGAGLLISIINVVFDSFAKVRIQQS